MKFRFVINAYPEIQACCDFLITRWQPPEAIHFYLQLYIEEYFTNLLKYTQHKKNSFGLQAHYQNQQLSLLFWDKTLSFHPAKGALNGLGTRLLTELFPYKYRSLKGVNFFWVKFKEVEK